MTAALPPSEQCQHIKQTFDLILSPFGVNEVRALKAGDEKYKYTMSGNFDADSEEAFLQGVQDCSRLKPTGIYITLNPAKAALLARCANRVKPKPEQATADEDIVCRRWILIDADVIRPAGISSTDAEHEAALERATSIRDYLRDSYAINAVLADSGNGGHVLVPCDLPNDKENAAESLTLVTDFLTALKARFGDDVIKVDTSVGNAARITKLYGTKVCKGDHTEERPHRYSRLLDVPAELPPVSVDVLRAIADTAPAKTPAPVAPRPATRPSGNVSPFDVPAFLSQHGLQVRNEDVKKDNCHHWNLEACPFDSSHTAPDSFIGQYPNGAVMFHCRHDSCKGYGWHEVRKKFDPTFTPYDPNRVFLPNRLKSPSGKRKQSAPMEEPKAPPAPDVVEAAKTFLAELWPLLETDPGAAYTEDALKHFSLLRSLPGEWARLKPAFKQHKVSIGDLQEAVHAFNKERIAQEAASLPDGGAGVRSLLEKPEEKPLSTAGDILINPPDRTLLIPPGYKVMENGIQDSEGETVSFAPVLVLCRLQDIEGQSESLRVAWQRPQGWKTLTAPRSVLLNSQQIISQADMGFPVSSDTARALVKYIHEFEAVNLNSDILPTQAVSSKLGWQGKDGEQGFLCGKQYITPAGGLWDADNPESPALVFHGKDDGEKQLAAAYTRKGSFERWQQVTAKLHGYPHVQMALLASFIPAILHIVDAANLVVDFSNKTSTGKTTSLRVAASVWGCPDTRQPDSIIHTWSMTRVWGERAAAILNGIPLFLDDTKQARKPAEVGQFIYDLASGSAKGRGSVKGTQAITRWRTVLLSTGEAPATSFDESGGSRTRTISVTRAPFGKDTEETAKFVRALNREVCDHYGHAGIQFAQWLLQQRSQWPEFARQYRDYIKEFDAGSGATSRMAEHLALFQIVGQLLQQSGILSGQVVGLSPELIRAIMQEAEEASGELRALNYVISWANAHASQFAGREAIDGRGDKKEPPVWSGRWDAPEESDLCFLPHILDNVLQEGKFDKTAIVRGWREKGWLDCGLDKIRNTKQVRMNNGRPHCVVIKYEALHEAEEGSELSASDVETAPQSASSNTDTNATPPDGLTDALRDMVRKARRNVAYKHRNDKSLLLQYLPRVEVSDLNLSIRQHADLYTQAWEAQDIDAAQESLKFLTLCEKFIREEEESFK